MSETIGFEVQIDKPYHQSMEKVVEALKSEGFGVLTQIDVKATLKEKLGEDFRQYAILGACNPPLAHRALSADPAIGLLLPCNVTVEDAADGGTMVRIMNPEIMLQVGDLGDLQEIRQVASEARDKLLRVADKLRS
jgi:uncharacterized protein (DUF302 family)